MYDLMKIATVELSTFLEENLKELSNDWWNKNVIDCLSFQQQRMAQEKEFKTLNQLDLAALLRVLDQNWYELSNNHNFPREARSWVKELQTVRNKWAHLSSESISPNELYRDADTLSRLLVILNANDNSLKTIETAKNTALSSMTENITPISKDIEPINNDASEEEQVTLFKVGDLVALRSDINIVFPIIEIIAGGTECRYQVFQNNTKNIYYESQLQPLTEKDTEHQKLMIKALRSHLTSMHILSPSTANLFSLRSGRVRFVPYQYRPVLKLIRADRPRLLIADEVGVGKTIEAGLIVKELRARMDISSVLVICPKALVSERKWFNEMKRFDEHFTALDGSLLRHCLEETHLEGEWPEQYAKSILPFSLFDSNLVFGEDGKKKKKGKGLLSLDPQPKFDLVIVDEAHHIRNPETFLHQGIRYFCDNAQAVVLLTATPVQLGSEDLFTLLNVLRPDLIIDHASFEKMAEPNQYINTAVQHCRSAEPNWQQEVHHCLDQVVNTEWGKLFLCETPAFQAVYDKILEETLTDNERIALTHDIENLYTFSSLINRTRRRDIGEFTIRKPETITIDFTPDQKQLHDALLDVVAKILAHCHGQQNVKFMMTTIRRQTASCLYGLAPLLSDILNGKLEQLEMMERLDYEEDLDLSFVNQVRKDIEILLEQARNLNTDDPKIKAFIKALIEKGKLPNNKAMVFSTFRHTLSYLAEHTEQAGIRYGLVHGGIPDDERADLRYRFSLPKENENAIDVLLSSEVGCEGLDFQFCDFLINYDLPWNPMRIEQRIGRIDRYGQESETVAIKNFITPGTVDADIYERCLWRIGVFQHAVGGSEEILGTITKEIQDIAESFSLTDEERKQRLQQISDNEIRLVQEETKLEDKQSELFGLNIPNQSWRDDIKDAETFWLSPTSIQCCIESYLTKLINSEVEHSLGDKALKSLRLNQEAKAKLLVDYKKLPRSREPIARNWEKWLKSTEPRLSITFDQQVAVDNPETIHLSIFHPLVRQAARFLNISEPLYCTLDVYNSEVPSGIYNFALYKWSKQGIKLDEFLVPVANDLKLENLLLDLLQSAKDTDEILLPKLDETNALDKRHHEKWIESRSNHVAENNQTVDYRIQSLTVSHKARIRTIEDQISKVTNDKIRLMKESELKRANEDFNARMIELEKSRNSADILTTPVIFGTISILNETRK